MICYDIETKKGPDEVDGGWDNPAGMGFGTAVAYDMTNDLYHFFYEHEKDDLISMLVHDGHVLTFNGVKFDDAVLLGNDPKPKWRNEDLLVDCVKAKFPPCQSIPDAVKKHGGSRVFDGSLNLQSLAMGTLGRRKTGTGAHAPQLIKEGRWSELWRYNLNDVRLTMSLWQFKRRHGFLVQRDDRMIRFPKGRLL